MSPTRFKTAIFVIEGLNAFAAGYYFNWLFFYTQKELHFGLAENLGLMALHGLIYTGAAWLGGWFGHRFGGFTALQTGFGFMALALGIGGFWPHVSGQIAVVLWWTLGMCFTWPTLQAFLSHGETSAALPRLAGIYNVVWAALAAVSFFLGGALLEWLGLKSIFFIPCGIHFGQWLWVGWLAKNVKKNRWPIPAENWDATAPAPPKREPSLSQKMFFRFALLANPMAYVAINTAIPLMPEVAEKFALTPRWAGFTCSVWFFARLGAFVWFWRWPGWHYRFGWLATAQSTLVVSFLGLLLAPQLWLLLLSQVVFGFSTGLIYYSSLFYSLDGGAAKTEHGGAHEAMIGLGIFLGAGVGAVSQYFWPAVPGISAWAVGGLLLIGLATLLGWRLRQRT